MCRIIEDLKQNQASGYKVVARINGEYYSTFTGQKYNRNWLPQIKGVTNLRVKSYYWATLNKYLPCYRGTLVGRTCVFAELEPAKLLANDIIDYGDENEIVVVKADVFGKISLGQYYFEGRGRQVYVGRRLVIKEVVHNY